MTEYPQEVTQRFNGTDTQLKAKDLVAPELLKGPNFTVDERVPVVGFLARFTLRSDFGTFDVHGIHMLQVRVPEIYALAQIDKMSKTQEFADADAHLVAGNRRLEDLAA